MVVPAAVLGGQRPDRTRLACCLILVLLDHEEPPVRVRIDHVDRHVRDYAEDPHLQLSRAVGANGSKFAQRRVDATPHVSRRVAPPARVLDVGGGPGAYATWLAADGYTVDLIDPVPLHVQQARQAAARAARPFSASLGDARHLPASDRSADVVLLLGPLYDLDADGRRQALTEAIRVLRHDGMLVAAAISRAQPVAARRAAHGLAGRRDLRRHCRSGSYDRPASQSRPGRAPEWFTTAWLHRPDELRRELEDAGLAVEAVLADEEPLALLNDLDERWQDDSERGRLLRAVQSVEHESSMLGVNAHLLAIARPRHTGRDR